MGGGPRFPFPKEVWSPAGGWWTGGFDNPTAWRRNTWLAAAGIVAVAVPLAIWGFRNDRRSPGHKPVYSERFAAHVDKAAYYERVREHNQRVASERGSLIQRLWPDKDSH